jgi:hypothetical protein
MKELCIVHVGMPKTGSTSLQNALFSGIRDPRVKYANISDVPEQNHSGIVYSLFSENPENHHYNICYGRNKDQINEFNARNKASLIEGFCDGSSSIEIISGEDIYHLTEIGVTNLYDFLKPYFHRIIIAGYVRSPKSFLESAFQQLVKHHHFANFDFSSIYHPYRNFYRFDRVFGKENVYLRLFAPYCFPNNDITLDFCQWFGIDFDEKKTVRENDSITQEVVAMLFAYNKYGNKMDTGIQEQLLQHMLIEMIGSVGETPFHFSHTLIDSVLQHNKDDIDWIEQRMNISLQELSVTNDTAISSEQELLEYSIKTIDVLKQLIEVKFLPSEPLNETPLTVAKLVEALKIKIKIDMGF